MTSFTVYEVFKTAAVNPRDDLPRNFPEGGKINGEVPDTSGPDLFTALKQHSGLELKAQKGLVEIIVADPAETLEAN